MKKSKLSLQFMIELVIIGIISLMVGAGIGSCLSVPVSNSLLENEIESASSKYNNIGSNFGMMPGENNGDSSDEKDTSKSKMNVNNMNFGVAKVTQVDSINAVVDFKVLSELLGIGVILILFSSMASMVAIARFSPLTILKERS